MSSSYFVQSDAICQKRRRKSLCVDVTVYLKNRNCISINQNGPNIACLLGISETQVSVKATTMEKRGLVGKEEGLGGSRLFGQTEYLRCEKMGNHLFAFRIKMPIVSTM